MSFGMLIAYGFFFAAVARFTWKMSIKHRNQPTPMVDLWFVIAFAIMIISGVFLGV